MSAATAKDLIGRGIGQADNIEHPVARARHLAAWAFRLAVIDPDAAAAMVERLPDEPMAAARLLLSAAEESESLRQDGEQWIERVLAAADDADANQSLLLVNALSELAIRIGERDPEAAIASLRRLAQVVDRCRLEESDQQPYEALAAALIGEALHGFGDPAGDELLQKAAELAVDMPGRDAILTFLANARIDDDPERAVALYDELADPGARLEARLIAVATLDPELHGDLITRVLDAAERDAAWVEHMRGPEALVRLATACAGIDQARWRRVIGQAVQSATQSGCGQYLALQLCGVAAVAADLDRELAMDLFQRARAAAETEGERVRRLTALALIAGEMASPFPREAAALLEEVARDAQELEAVWEFAHLFDVILRPDRSPYLDPRPMLPVLLRFAEQVAEDDPQIPGVVGLAEVGRLVVELDADAGLAILRRWFDACEAAANPDGMAQAARTIRRHDEALGDELLERTQRLLVGRTDCPAMVDFVAQAATDAPRLALDLARRVPDSRDRAQSIVMAVAPLHAVEPAAAMEAVDELESPVDRSLALLGIVDELLDTHERYRPEPLLEDMP